MNIKSLLIGSAAALATVSGAQAADAIMAAEPEPVEYVRVCDAFGTGFFYIPGTETCLHIFGYVRYDIGGGELAGLDTTGDGKGDSWNKRARFSFRTDTRTATELGTLRSYTEVRFQYDNNKYGFYGDNVTQAQITAIAAGTAPLSSVFGSYAAHEVTLNFAYIELGDMGKVRIGKDESAYTTYLGYAGGVIQDTLVPYGPFDTTVIQYRYNVGGEGFSAILSLEDDSGGSNNGNGNYVPDIVAGVGYKAGAWQFRAVGGYDESAEDGAIKVRIDGSAGPVSGFLMAGFNTDGSTKNNFAPWTGDWAIWGGLSADVTERIAFNSQLSYDDGENFGAAANLVFTVVPGFAVTTELSYKDNFNSGSNSDLFGGNIRFQRDIP